MRRYAILLLAATGLAGCQTASNDFVLGPTDADVTGTFGLSSINGGPLPIVAQVTTTDEWDLTADTLRISGDSTFTLPSFIVTRATEPSKSYRTRLPIDGLLSRPASGSRCTLTTLRNIDTIHKLANSGYAAAPLV